MRTITFYSYKGGVGRSLLVANAAKYLSTLGKKVFALDLDLEAPGLHYKFELGADTVQTIAPGLVDILAYFKKTDRFPNSLANYVTEVEVDGGAEVIHIMRAGAAPLGEYWRTLSDIDWHDLFYGADPVGAMFFLELKELLRQEFDPDFLLIDARTGITEMGGVATTLLADTVVCIGLASVEHLEGLRAVMQGIKRSTLRDPQLMPVSIVPVVSRVPVRKDASSEEKLLAETRSFLNTPTRDDIPGLDLEQVIALHSEPLLDSAEQLLVGGKNSPHDLPLLRDYLMLFSRIIPTEDIHPHVGQLIQQATARLLDNPDGAQSDLEALTTYCADQEAYRALLKLYLLRKAPVEKLVATAALMWQLCDTKSRPDPLLVDIVKIAFTEPRAMDVQKKYVDFAEDIWRWSGMKDINVGMTIANAFVPDRRDKAVRLLSAYVDKADPPNSVAIVRLIDLLRGGLSFEVAFSVVERFKMTDLSAEFQAAWARLVLDRKDPRLAKQTLQNPAFRPSAVRASDPATLYRLYRVSGTETEGDMLQEAIDVAAGNGDVRGIREIGEILLEEGRLEELEPRVAGRVPGHVLEDIVETLQRRGRRPRYMRP